MAASRVHQTNGDSSLLRRGSLRLDPTYRSARGRVEASADNGTQRSTGVLTDQPLWPWPMNQRIAGAIRSAGCALVDVTATAEGLLGSIR